MWVNRILLLWVLALSVFCLWERFAIGGEVPGPIIPCETRLLSCNQVWMQQSKNMTKLLDDITISKKQSATLEDKLLKSDLTQANLQSELAQSKQREEVSRQHSIDIQKVSEEVIKGKDSEISKWRSRCIWAVLIGAGALALSIAK
jgi:hypothetical protein